jgi:mRNA interferase RelE/StbE
MKTNFAKHFDKDVNKINTATILDKIEQAILDVERALTMREIPILKKLKGYRIHYRIRVGSYRIGVEIENGMATFRRCLPRKAFCTSFP